METIKRSGSHALLTCSHIIFILSLTNITGRAPYGVVQLVGNKCDSDLYPLLAVFYYYSESRVVVLTVFLSCAIVQDWDA